MSERNLPMEGRKSPRFGHLGMWNFCLGPASPLPGDRLRVGILDLDGKVVRRFEQIRGNCIDEGYVDFFMSHRCRPATHEMPIVDIDSAGKINKVLCPHYAQDMGMGLYLKLLEAWVTEYGRREWAL
jgi:hypothetical protein